MGIITLIKTASVGKTTDVAALTVPLGKPPAVRFCRECGRPFHPARHDQDFCVSACRKAYHARRQANGVALYDFAMKWRGERLRGGFTDLCRMIDGWLSEERDRRKQHEAIREAYRKGQSK